MNSVKPLLPKYTSLLAIGASLLSCNYATAAGVVTAGDQFAAAVSDGTIRTWGLNTSGQLGLGNTVSPQPTPTDVAGEGTGYFAVEAGPDFMFGIVDDSDTDGVNAGQVYAWGANGSAQLGIGTQTSVSTPTVISSFPATGTNSPKLVDVAAAYDYAYAIDMAGNLYGWGNNFSYQLGLGTNKDPNPDSAADYIIEVPYKLSGTWKDVAASKSPSTVFTVGIKSDGTLWVWGEAASAVGGPTGIQIKVPYRLGSASNWEEVEVGNLQVIARNSSGQVYTWGNGVALGQGFPPPSLMTPTLISASGVSSWQAIGVGFETTFAIDSTGRLWGWGNNYSKQLGVASGDIVYAPQLVATSGTFEAVAGGYGSIDDEALDGFTVTQATISDEGFYTFGGNASGQLGTGSISFGLSTTPQRASADGFQISVTAPTVNNTTSNIQIGVNTTINVTTSVVNSGEVAINGGYKVEVFLDSSPTLTSSASSLASVDINDSLPFGGSNSVSFSDLEIEGLDEGQYYIYSQVTLLGTASDTNNDDNTKSTPVSIKAPNVALTNLDIGDGDSITLPADFTNVTVDLSNTAIGVINSGTNITITAYLSDDGVLNTSEDTKLTISPSIDYSSGLDAGEVVNLGPTTIEVPSNISSGNKTLFLIASENNTGIDSDTSDSVIKKSVSLFTPERIDVAFDYGYFEFTGANGKWTSIDDNLASGGVAYISPTLAQTQSASITTMVIGPTTINAPWRIEADAADDVSITVAGGAFSYPSGSSNTISGYVPTYQTNEVELEDSALYTVTWTYNQNSTFTNAFALLDLDIPSFVSSGDAEWGGVDDGTAPVGSKSVKTPSLDAGQSSSFEVDVIGPALISFWIKTATEASDTVSFYVDGTLQSLPTTDFDDTAVAATFSGTHDWQRVAFLVEGGERTLRWTYNKLSDSTTSEAFVDGLAVLSPIPEENSPNRNNDVSGAYDYMPQYNVDLAVQDVVAETGTYILDDSQGTGRLPVTVVVGSVGADFDISTINASFAGNIQLRLSDDTIYGDADDVLLGSFASTQVVNEGDKIVLSADVNLPLDTPAGNYNLFVRFVPPPVIEEFSYLNNTEILGPGFVIVRAPDLEVTSISTPSVSYPYHPEDTILLDYVVFNRGLGTVSLDEPFDVSVSLLAVDIDDLAEGEPILVKAYDAFELSVFLPEVSATYPNGGSTNVSQYLSLPSLRDFLVAIGEVDAGTPEDAGVVTAKQNELYQYLYYFQISLDSSNQIVESSETNDFWSRGYDEFDGLVKPTVFSVSPTPGTESYGSYTSQYAFSDYLNGTEFPDLSLPTLNSDGDALVNLLEYAMATDPTQDTAVFIGSADPAPYGSSLGSYNVVDLTIPPSSSDESYLTMTFDFNVRATDIIIFVQGSSSLVFPNPVEDDSNTYLLQLKPPYIDDFGPQSLTGFNGLKDNPLVLSVEGNVTATNGDGTGGIQKVYSARLTVRDVEALSLLGGSVDYGSRFMRVVVASSLTTPDPLEQPQNMAAAYNGNLEGVQLSWDPLPSYTADMEGAYQILRTVGTVSGGFIADYEAIASVTASTASSSYLDTDVVADTSYTYKVRFVNSAGASAESDPDSATVP